VAQCCENQRGGHLNEGKDSLDEATYGAESLAKQGLEDPLLANVDAVEYGNDGPVDSWEAKELGIDDKDRPEHPTYEEVNGRRCQQVHTHLHTHLPEHRLHFGFQFALARILDYVPGKKSSLQNDIAKNNRPDSIRIRLFKGSRVERHMGH